MHFNSMFKLVVSKGVITGVRYNACHLMACNDHWLLWCVGIPFWHKHLIPFSIIAISETSSFIYLVNFPKSASFTSQTNWNKFLLSTEICPKHPSGIKLKNKVWKLAPLHSTYWLHFWISAQRHETENYPIIFRIHRRWCDRCYGWHV